MEDKKTGPGTRQLTNDAPRSSVVLEVELLSKLRDHQAQLSDREAKYRTFVDVSAPAIGITLALWKPVGALKHNSNPDEYSTPMFWNSLRQDFDEISWGLREKLRVIEESGYADRVAKFRSAYNEAVAAVSEACQASEKRLLDKVSGGKRASCEHANAAFNTMADVARSSVDAAQAELAALRTSIELVSSDVDSIRKRIDEVAGTRPSEARATREPGALTLTSKEGEVKRTESLEIRIQAGSDSGNISRSGRRSRGSPQLRNKGVSK